MKNTVLKLTKGKRPYMVFPDENEVIFFQDHSWWKGMPHNIKFYIDKLSSRGVWLVADGYGVLKDNKLGLTGSYGNGKICVDFKYLNEEIEKFCREKITDT